MLRPCLAAPAGCSFLAVLAATLVAAWPRTAAFGQEQPPRLAVVQLDAFAFGPVPAARMTETFRKAIADTGAFQVLQLGARGNVPCRDLACALAIARQARATRVVYGGIVELDPDNWLLSATLASVDTGQVIRTLALDQAGSPASGFSAGFKTLADRLARPPEEIAAAPAPAPPPAPAPAPRPSRQPEQRLSGPGKGLGIALGYETLSGKIVPKGVRGGSGVTYSLQGAGFGLDYQWPIFRKFSALMYLRGLPGAPLGGQAGPAFKQGSSYGLGGEIRYWIGQAFLGGALEAASTMFTGPKGGSSGVLANVTLSGGGIGAVAGYEWLAGWQILLSVESTNLSGNVKLSNGSSGSTSPSGPVEQPLTAQETKTLLTIGYRF